MPIELTDGPGKKRMAKASRDGLARNPESGLLVPAELVTRKRKVLTRADWKHLQRAITEVLEPLTLKFLFICAEPDCTDPRIHRIREPNGGYLLRCACTDRELEADL